MLLDFLLTPLTLPDYFYLLVPGTLLLCMTLWQTETPRVYVLVDKNIYSFAFHSKRAWYTTVLRFNTRAPVFRLNTTRRLRGPAATPQQAFQNFVDARIQPEAGDLDVVFFDACIAAKRNRSLLHVTKKSDANFLRYALQEDLPVHSYFVGVRK